MDLEPWSKLDSLKILMTHWYAKGVTKIANRVWALDQSVALWGSESAIQG